MQPRCQQNKKIRIKNRATAAHAAHAQGRILVLMAISSMVGLPKALSTMDHYLKKIHFKKTN